MSDAPSPSAPAAELPTELADTAADQLLALDAGQRADRLAQLQAAHPCHAAALARLCAELDGAERLLAAAWSERPSEAGAEIGGHRVLRKLGEGAFGQVFLCAQQQPVVRNVAVKVLRPGTGDEQTLRRFAAERQLLASLNHPSIAQVFDAGALPDGRPFFVMEYIDGRHFRRYCDEQALALPQRLRLFVELCHAVAHANSRGIVHRDLKPANVLVVTGEHGPLPKIIDFGIAKALLPGPGSDGPRTDTGRAIGTPGYMSPEQADGRAAEVDQRADVFALGVMLYEVLTGELPWLQGAAATGREPVRPSARVTTTGAPWRSPARRQLAADLRGDLDWITLKALARDREERYAGAGELAADIERHLAGEPVSVGPPSAIYRLRKFVRRNRGAVLAAAGGGAVAAAALALMLLQGSAAEAAVASAQQSAATNSAKLVAAVADAQQMAAESSAKVVAAEAAAADAQRSASDSFAEAVAMVDQLLRSAHAPEVRDAPKGDATRARLLQQAQASSERLLALRPTDTAPRARRCRSLTGLAHVHYLLGEAARASELATAAVAEARALLAGAPDSFVYRALLGEALRRQGAAAAVAGSHAAAEPLFVAAAEALAVCAAAAPADYGRSHAGALREAAQALPMAEGEQRLLLLQQSLAATEALQRSQPQLAELADDFVLTSWLLGNQLYAMRRMPEADAALQRAEAALPGVAVDRPLHTFEVYSARARLLWQVPADRPQALQCMRTAIDAARQWQQDQPQRLLAQAKLTDALRDLGFYLNYSGDFATADEQFRAAIAQGERTRAQFAEDASQTLMLVDVLWDFAMVLSDRFRQAELPEAVACAARAVALDAAIPPAIDVGRRPRWQLLGMQALLEDARRDGRPDWQAVEAALADPEMHGPQQVDALAGALTGVARWRLQRGDDAAADAWLQRARKLIAANRRLLDKRMVEVGWLQAQLAIRGGDAAAAAALADVVLQARPTWFGKRRAADCLAAAFRAQRQQPLPAADEWRRRAAALYGEVIAELRPDVDEQPLDPWYVLPWGFASVRAAELAVAAGDDPAASLELALQRLAAVEPEAHRDQWEPEVVQQGRALAAQLAQAQRR